ncbi:MAG: helix-turn-helix transcriptional regulator [Hyphomicrobium sp.]
MTVGDFVAKDLPALLDLLYGAAVDRNLWPVFLQALMKPFDGASGVLHFFDIETQAVPFAQAPGNGAEYILSYQEHFSSLTPYAIQSFGKVPRLDERPTTFALSKSDVLDTDLYHEWMKPQGITPDHVACVVHNEGKELVILEIAPSDNRIGRRADRYAKHFELLAPHLKRAVALSKTTRADNAQAALPAQFACGALLISQSRTVKAVNPPAENLLREGALISIDALGKLRVKDADGQMDFLSALHTVFERHEPIGGPVHCRTTESEKRISIVIAKLPAGDRQTALVLLMTKSSVVDLSAAPFTAAEARLAMALLDGQTLADYSEQVGISINTARKQLAALFAKTGTNRQAALVAWLLQRNS